MESCCEFILDLENELSRMKEALEDISRKIGNAILQCIVTFGGMSTFIGLLLNLNTNHNGV